MMIVINFDKHPDNESAKQKIYDIQAHEVDPSDLIGKKIVAIDEWNTLVRIEVS